MSPIRAILDLLRALTRRRKARDDAAETLRREAAELREAVDDEARPINGRRRP